MTASRGGGSSQERGVAMIMEDARRDDATGAAAEPQGPSYYGPHGGDGGYDGTSGGVELSLRLSTGSTPPPAAAAAAAAPAEQQQETAARGMRRSMTIFYDGRVCAVDVTENQAMEIISMATQEILARQRQQHRDERHWQDRGSTSCNSSSATARCGVGGQVRPPVASAAGCPRQGVATMAAPTPAPTDQSGLSMKRSLQRFLQKREARRAAAAAPPYAAGGGRQAQAI